MPERFKVVCTMQGAIQVLSLPLPLPQTLSYCTVNFNIGLLQKSINEIIRGVQKRLVGYILASNVSHK